MIITAKKANLIRNRMFYASDVLWTINTVGNNDGKLAGNVGQEDICFCGGMVAGLSSCNTVKAAEVS